MKKGLVLEGGAMRGLWTAGVIDVMMENNIWPDGIIGVSAGAAFGCNYKSRQIGRTIRYNMRFAKDKRYSGLLSLFTSGNYFNADFAYHKVPMQYDVFDSNTFQQNEMEFHIVCTDVNTGKAVYHQIKEVNEETLEWIRASSSMPVLSSIVNIGKMRLLDGGVSDSIPLKHFEDEGFKRNIVILTQPKGYKKKRNKLMILIRLFLHRYPLMVKAMEERYIMYNRQLEYIEQAELKGRCLVLRPEEKIPIGHISHNPKEMRKVYEMGRNVGLKYLDRISAFLSNDALI